MTESRYETVVTAPAARAIRDTLLEVVAFAVIDFITGPLLDNPQRVGAALRNELEGVRSARRGTYRVLYRIDDDRREAIVLRVGHRQMVEFRGHKRRQHQGGPSPTMTAWQAS